MTLKKKKKEKEQKSTLKVPQILHNNNKNSNKKCETKGRKQLEEH